MERDREDAREMVATRRVRLSGNAKGLMSEDEDGRGGRTVALDCVGGVGEGINLSLI